MPLEVVRPRRVSATPLATIVTSVAGLAWDKQTSAELYGSVRVSGIAQSTATVLPGDLYVAVPGARFHGAQFAEQARDAGAVTIVTDQRGATLANSAGLPILIAGDPRSLAGPLAAFIYGDPSRSLTIIGITGTNGKTTTSYLVEAGLRAAGHTTGVIGTVETRLGDTSIPAVRTTPEAPELQALLATAVERGVTAVVMEVSSHALALSRVEGTHFTVGAFTNLSVDHLDFHSDLEDYFAAKARLFDGRCDHEVVNLDDEYGRRLVHSASITVSTQDTNEAATWRSARFEQDGFAQRFTVHGPAGTSVPASVALPGEFNVSNALVAIASLVASGVQLSDAVAGVASARGVPGRMERVATDAPVLAVVDYAHAPDGVAKALEALRPVTGGQLICVLGCGGDRDVSKRPAMGQTAAAGADVFVATDDNPRSEDSAVIRAQMLSGVTSASKAEVREVPERRDAIMAAVSMSRPGDTIAVLGKGHEQGQQVGDVVHPFDDRLVLAAAVNEVYG